MTHCPHCQQTLTDEELRRLWAQRNSARRSTDSGGRPPKLTPSQQSQARRRAAAGESQAAIARSLGVHRATIQRLLSD